MVGRGDCVYRGCHPFWMGRLVPCQGPHGISLGDGSSGSTGGVGRIAKTNRARPRDYPPRKCTTIHRFTDLFPHKRISEEVVCGYRGTAETTKNRYQGLVKDHAVSQQDVDNAVGTYSANKATFEANQANVKQLQALQSFEKIYAPFDGVVTARNIDIGDLINSGSSGGVKTDLFHISQPRTLRVYVNVPEEYSQGIRNGMTADLSLAEFPGRKFQGKLVRTADAINMTTRTLLIEVDVDNPKGTLLTGSYAEVHLAVPAQNSTYLLPVNTLLFRSEGLRVGIVKDGKVTLSAVTPGHDFGNEIEIVSGLKADDQVIINPPDSIVSGQEVQIVQATLPGDIK